MRGNFDFNHGTTRFESLVAAGEPPDEITWLASSLEPVRDTRDLIMDSLRVSADEARRAMQLAEATTAVTGIPDFGDVARRYEEFVEV